MGTGGKCLKCTRQHALFAQACAHDLEGIVAKLADVPYRATQPKALAED